MNPENCHLFAAVPPVVSSGLARKFADTVAARCEVDAEFGVELGQCDASTVQGGVPQTTAPAPPPLTDEELSAKLYDAWGQSNGEEAGWLAAARRAREILQPPATVPDGAFWCRRARCAEHELCGVLNTLAGLDEITKIGCIAKASYIHEIAQRIGLTIIPAEPAKPIRVEIAK